VLSLLIVVMLWPSAGTRRYLAYKNPLFIFTILFEAWFLLAGVALHFPSGLEDKDFWSQLTLVGFFLGTVAISLPGVDGEYRKGVFFRPDLLYGNGAYLARGEIFVALGIKLFTSPEVAHPIAGAFVLIVLARGYYKTRLDEPASFGADLVKGLLLWVGFVILIYGFLLIFNGIAWLGPYGPGSPNFWWGVWVSTLGPHGSAIACPSPAPRVRGAVTGDGPPDGRPRRGDQADDDGPAPRK
jgi:hypothetical protein